ncbi:hypothetical protein, partial [Pseudomonas syringae group genomosp. 3]|uniref:hypothetical protein n=1 Tax=Pseudomonas syringae group genomosp. 3 TaxID=251701 RepID=UPI000A65E693
GIFEFGEGFLHARNAHGEGGWLKELSVPRVGTVGYFCSASLDNNQRLVDAWEANGNVKGGL